MSLSETGHRLHTIITPLSILFITNVVHKPAFSYFKGEGPGQSRTRVN